MREFYSPYVGMGNNPINLIDRRGGSTDPPKPGDINTETNQVYGLNATTGEYEWSDMMTGVEIQGSWNWFNELMYRLEEGGGGVTFMNSKGLGGAPIYDVRKGTASHIALDPTEGIVVFRTPNRMIKLNYRENIGKSDIERIQKFINDGYFLFEFGYNSAGVAESILEGVLNNNHQVHGSLKVFEIKPDSVPVIATERNTRGPGMTWNEKDTTYTPAVNVGDTIGWVRK